MPAIIELTPDGFSQGFSEASGVQQDARTNSFVRAAVNRGVRRPVRGLQIKEETFATIEVRTAAGTPQLLIDSGNQGIFADDAKIGRTTRYSNFLIQSVSEQRAEKSQIVETFGEPYVFFYGEHPRMLQVSGELLNSADFNWRAEWWENYDKYLRGTKCVQNKTRVVLTWDDIVVQGYMMNAQSQDAATEPLSNPFSFSLFITHYENVSTIGDTDFPQHLQIVNLDPDTLDVEGDPSVRQNQALVSSTVAVRAAASNGFGQASLLSKLRQGILDVATNAQAGLDAALLQTSSFLLGRNVQMPLGFAGGSVFDDLQISLGSLTPDQALNGFRITLAGNRTLTIPSTMAGTKFLAPHFGKIAENSDEFIANDVLPQSGGNPPNLFGAQATQNADIAKQMKNAFKLFGIDTDPPNQLLRLAAKATFALTTIAVNEAKASALSSRKDTTSQTARDGSLVVSVLP